MPLSPKIKVCVDSNVLISCLRQEIGGDFKLLSEESEKFFALCGSKGICLVIPELFFEEVETAVGLKKQDTLEALDGFGAKTEILSGKFKVDYLEPFRHLVAHRSDAIYACSAKVSGAFCLVTWNKKHFTRAAGTITILTPAEFNDNFPQCTFWPARP